MTFHDAPSPLPPPTHVRYQVLAVACILAVLTYINRLGFGLAAPEIKDGLGLTNEQMGELGSAFLIAYGLFQMPGGRLGDRLGGRRQHLDDPGDRGHGCEAIQDVSHLPEAGLTHPR